MERKDLTVKRVDRDSFVGAAFPRFEIFLPDGWNYGGCHSLIAPKADVEKDIQTILRFAEPCGPDCEACG